MAIDMNTLNIQALTSTPSAKGDTSTISKAKEGFSELLSSTLNRVNDQQIQSDKAIEQFHSGKAENMHEVMIAVEQADISLRMLVQMRNKAQAAYEEIMRMQV